MRVPRVEAVGDPSAALVEHDVLTPVRPLAGQRPVVQAQALRPRIGAVLAARRAEIRLGRPQMVPVGLRLHAEPFDGDELALDAEQLLDYALRLLIASFAEVGVANYALR